jgi:fumarate reductase subunit C
MQYPSSTHITYYLLGQVDLYYYGAIDTLITPFILSPILIYLPMDLYPSSTYFDVVPHSLNCIAAIKSLLCMYQHSLYTACDCHKTAIIGISASKLAVTFEI